ncbi:ABC transporter ATP-binding protein [Aureimonas jatrophae]|uniref:Carbohydrate ABC transporter ATP-binding protein, CUT1 family n=1 Tax=Aureimonas jatrophae TaxID=1166073 RepID=A0A1H0IE81_9HYPH|nr:ABC transporter ATP-binding protein [Aureimonas jatrophae]MBB3952119.1 iron(III) transport system ATP-binding protein [Aureimonas jatrophae]SDO29708.1 carbohydrate ABC transporter ATP-binding protein, CUT1 family [Aureimonas jatrophae]
MALPIVLSRLSKRFGSSNAVDDVSLEIQAGEFLALLGPSGCGKTTLLRMIAGFETASEGQILFGDRMVAGHGVHVLPEERNVAIVFQSYALWPHMSVAENVAYPLRVRRRSRADREAKVAEALAAVDLSGFETRRIADLSGGQRQRVALARCLAMDPGIILLDEPLANLDVHLRASMEETFARFHERTGATMVYVTHDQSEAMAMATRVAVMERGRILECAAPATLYGEPAGEAVARFIGDGRIVDAEVLSGDGAGRCRVRLLGTEADIRCPPGRTLRGPGRVCLRAEGLELTAQGAGLAATVRAASFKGAHTRLSVEPLSMPGLVLTVAAPHPVAVGATVSLRVADGWLLPRAASSVAVPVADAARELA